MRLWQHRARLAVATLGIAFAIATYAAVRERREPPPPAPPPERIDPRAVIESSGNVVQQARGTKQDFLIKAEQQLTYEGGATKLLRVEISVNDRGGRDYVIKANEAQAGERQQELQLRGGVQLKSSDGFELSTEEAFFSEADGQMRAPGAFSFSRRLMTGTGKGMTYDRMNDVLTVVSTAEIRLTDEGGNTRTQFLAGNAIFTRPEHLIVMGGKVHILHNEQVADAARAAVHLNEEDSLLTRIELREDAELNGGGKGVDRLRGQAIDLNYAADGQALSQVHLENDARVISGSGASSRDIRGRTIDMLMAEGGALSHLTARDSVQLIITGSAETPTRNIEARQLDADADQTGSLSAARFDGNVVYREAPGPDRNRIVRARGLRVQLDEDEISSATFVGNVEFEEGALEASGPTMRYEPTAGSLVIAGGEGGNPKVSDEQVSVEATKITVAIDSRDMQASGTVRTTLRPRQDASPARGTGARGGVAPSQKLPGLFEQGRVANGNADAFEYSGGGGQAVYSGNATLWQGETTVRGDRVTLDRASGDLRVTGSARSTLNLASGRSQSRSTSLSYIDRERTITYEGDASGAQLSGPDGDLRATHIVVALAAMSNRVDTLTGSGAVSLKLDTRTATGEKLTYTAAEEKYVMTGVSRTPVRIVETCRETTGSTLTFYKSADRIVIDGNESVRTQSVRGQQCSDTRRR